MLQQYDIVVRKEGHFTVWAESTAEAKEMITDMDGEDLDKYAEWDEPEISCFMRLSRMVLGSSLSGICRWQYQRRGDPVQRSKPDGREVSMERLKRMQRGVDEVIALVNSRHGIGSFEGDIQRIADEAFKDCQFTDEECRHAAWLGFYENFRMLLNERTQHRCINGGICTK